jgi:hypothetical protein
VSGLTNLMLAIPSLVFALAIMAILGPGLVSLVIALGLTSWSYSCRIARAQVLSLKSQGYVQAARILGYGDLRIMFTQVLPNILGPLIVIATLGHGRAPSWPRPPSPSWGLASGRPSRAGAACCPRHATRIRAAPWLSVSRALPSSSPCSASTFWAMGYVTSRSAVADEARMNAPLLEVDDLHITLQGDGATFNAVENVSFEIGRGEAFGLVASQAAARASPRSPSWACCADRWAWARAASCSTARRSRTPRLRACASCAAAASP